MTGRYLDLAIGMLKEIKETQISQIDRASNMVADAFSAGGVLHVFGTGHSHIIVEEAFGRAGGMIPIAPIFESSLMLHEGALKSGYLERVPGIAKVLLDTHEAGVRKEDVALIVSNSGRNTVPVEMAELFREKGVPVIAITSLAHSKKVDSRAPSGHRLFEAADVTIDTTGPYGDAGLEMEGLPAAICATSTVTGAAIFWSIVEGATSILISRGEAPPVLVSDNVDHGEEWNEKAFLAADAKWGDRLWHIRAAVQRSREAGK